MPLGASGSSTIMASDFASDGIDPIFIAGLIFSPLQLYLTGISDPSEKAGLVIVRLFI
jgi:hypothetical protein